MTLTPSSACGWWKMDPYTMSKQIHCTHTLIRAENIDQFRSKETKKRILKMPYYRKHGSVLVFDFITEETNARELKAQIELGEIWVVEKSEINEN